MSTMTLCMEDETIVSAVTEHHSKAVDEQCPEWGLNL